MTVNEAQITVNNYASTICSYVTNTYFKATVLTVMNSTFLSSNMTADYPLSTKYFTEQYKQFTAGGAKCVKFFSNLQIPFRADLLMNKKRYTNIQEFMYNLAMSKLGSILSFG